jgi:DNA-binding transcriptional ArsR family regulator
MRAKRAVGALSALAQETRLAVFRMLVREAPGGITAGVIAERLRVPPATLSFHLAQLDHARLVRARRHSRHIVYTANVEGIRDLLGFLTEDCCQGRPELCDVAARPRRRAAAG